MKRFLTMMAMASISMMTMAQSTLGSGLNVADFDKSVRPGDDFYEYACGGWMKKWSDGKSFAKKWNQLFLIK